MTNFTSPNLSPPWWLCIPKEAPPVLPTRPTSFVLFADYDVDFKYPLGSSRVLAPKFAVPMEEGCQGCGPELINEEDTPISKLISYAYNPGNCGPSSGYFFLDPPNANSDMETALTGATTVTITGIYQSSENIDDFSPVLDEPLPDFSPWVSVTYPMEFDTDSGTWVTAYIEEIGSSDSQFGYWFRVTIDGAEFYGGFVLKTPC